MTYNSSLPLIVMKSCQIAPISTGSLNSPIRMFITEVSYRIQRCKSTYVFDKIPHRQFRILFFFTNIDKTSDEKINRMIIAKCPFCCFSIILNGYILYFRGGPKPLRDESRINFQFPV